MIITVIGGLIGVVVVILDELIQNEWMLIIFAMLGVLLTFMGCKLAKVLYINAKIGTITFILVIMVMQGTHRILYALQRLAGTFYGTVIAVVITMIWVFFSKKKETQN